MTGESDSPRSNTQTAPTRPARYCADGSLNDIFGGIAFPGHVDEARLGVMHIEADSGDVPQRATPARAKTCPEETSHSAS